MGSTIATRSPGRTDVPRRATRLASMDFRRGYGFWLVPALIALGCLYYARASQPDPVLWGYRSVHLSWSFAILGPVGAAWGAWLAGRERRSRTETLLASTSTSTMARDLRALLAPTIGALAAYAGIGAFVLTRTAMETTWGGPVWSVILYGAWMITAYTVVGTVAGLLVPARLTPMIAGFGLLLFTTLTYTYFDTQSAFRYLTPFRWVSDPHAYDDVLFHGARSGGSLVIPFALALGVALAAAAMMLAVRSGWRRASLIGVVAALVLVPSVDAAIAPLGQPAQYRFEPLSGLEVGAHGPVENPPVVCAGEIVETCIHKAFASDLDAVAAQVDATLAPVAGLPGVPTRFEQRADLPSSGDTARFTETWQWGNASFVVEQVAIGHLFPDASRAGGDRPAAQTPAQAAIGLWLARQAGGVGFLTTDIAGYEFPRADGQPSDAEIATWRADVDAIHAEIDAAAERFAALSPEEQRAWLDANWEGLRAGDLTLEDLP